MNPNSPSKDDGRFSGKANWNGNLCVFPDKRLSTKKWFFYYLFHGKGRNIHFQWIWCICSAKKNEKKPTRIENTHLVLQKFFFTAAYNASQFPSCCRNSNYFHIDTTNDLFFFRRHLHISCYISTRLKDFIRILIKNDFTCDYHGFFTFWQINIEFLFYLTYSHQNVNASTNYYTLLSNFVCILILFMENEWCWCEQSSIKWIK